MACDRRRRTARSIAAGWVRVAAFALPLVAATAGARNVGGVELPEQIELGGETLVLNGGGVRTRYFVDVAATGLYLPRRSADADAIIAADEPMAVRLHVISSLVTVERMADSVERGFELSTGGDTAPYRREIDALIAAYGDGIDRGDVYDIVWVPGAGLAVYKNGESHGTVAGDLRFKRALFGVWLSERPVQGSLKRAMLGH